METKQKRRKVVVSLLTLVGLLVFSLFATGGNLEPSAPPGPTMKTLDEVEPRIPISSLPYTISASGSYCLTGDVTGITSQHGITVGVDDVTIDLMGYQLIGPDPNDGTECGIYMNARSNVEIRNGTVRDFNDHGIYEASSNGRAHRVIGVRAVSNGDSGIYIRGNSHLVKDCTAIENGGMGIRVKSRCMITGNTACSNQGSGIYAEQGCMVVDNTAQNNQSVGIEVGNGCIVTGNTTWSNEHDGIDAGIGCTVTGNNVFSNNQSNTPGKGGIWVGYSCLVKGNTVCGNSQNNIGVDGLGNAIEENLVTTSVPLPSGNGIYFYLTGNFYANNRASGNVEDYNDVPGNNYDGGGNISF